jgi:metal transporter CNNM
MIITSLVSYPLALLLDSLSGKQNGDEIFTHSELATLVEHSGHGGMVGKDTARIMLGALQLDSRKVGNSVFNSFEQRKIAICVAEKEVDLEMSDLVSTSGMVVPWSAVKTVHIDEPVNGDFIRKVRGWSCSRIPVVGNQDQQTVNGSDSGGNQIFGFLNIKVGFYQSRYDCC